MAYTAAALSFMFCFIVISRYCHWFAMCLCTKFEVDAHDASQMFNGANPIVLPYLFSLSL